VQGARSTKKISEKVGTFFTIDNFLVYFQICMGGHLGGDKSYFKKMTNCRLNPKNHKKVSRYEHFDTLIRQLCPRAI
jgi:hypothetical protein